MTEHGLLEKYSRFVITRSDFLYQLPHPKLHFMSEDCAWVPNGEHYRGYTDRHAVLSKSTVVPYLDIFNKFVHKSVEYFEKMRQKNDWNLEQLIQFHLGEGNVPVREFPYIMYSVRTVNGSTRWAQGVYSEELGYNIKYQSEFNLANYYKDRFIDSGKTVESFYDAIFRGVPIQLI